MDFLALPFALMVAALLVVALAAVDFVLVAAFLALGLVVAFLFVVIQPSPSATASGFEGDCLEEEDCFGFIGKYIATRGFPDDTIFGPLGPSTM